MGGKFNLTNQIRALGNKAHWGESHIITRTCDSCGSEITKHRSQLVGKRAFCDRRCAGLYRRGRLVNLEGEPRHGSGVALTDDAKYVSWRKNERNRLKRISPAHHTYEQWVSVLKQHRNRCASCGTSERLTEDHIMPLSKGGSDDISNIQPLCRACNTRKLNRLIGYHHLYL